LLIFPLSNVLQQVVGTGESIRRAWYDAKARCDGANATPVLPHIPGAAGKFAPNVLLAEPGAVLCRVSRSFLRFGQLELFAQRQEWSQLLQLADFLCFREYPDLLEIHPQSNGGAGGGGEMKTGEIKCFCLTRLHRRHCQPILLLHVQLVSEVSV
jgi:hypothetical protein